MPFSGKGIYIKNDNTKNSQIKNPDKNCNKIITWKGHYTIQQNCITKKKLCENYYIKNDIIRLV